MAGAVCARQDMLDAQCRREGQDSQDDGKKKSNGLVSCFHGKFNNGAIELL